jgi:uncharacterized protein YfaP (DUF2135 family)
MRRTLLLLLLVSIGLSGCKTAEVVFDYPVTGIRVAAKFEAREPAPLVVQASSVEVAVAEQNAATATK